MIAVNWGSSNFRAYRLSENYEQIAERSSSQGAANVIGGKFLDTLMEEVGGWIDDGETRVLMSGMVGSRYGWQEVPYVALPAGVDQICEGVTSINSEKLDLRIVPGLVGQDASAVAEVMRGEEAEILGCMNLSSHERICLPGTHSKWAEIKDEKIVTFSTYMTGELFQAIRSSTILGRSMHADSDDSGFDRGVMRAKEPEGLMHHLFGVRSMVLIGTLSEEAAKSYLSGLLIGHELKHAMNEQTSLHLVGDESLCALYARAAKLLGTLATVEPERAALRGLTMIARRLSW